MTDLKNDQIFEIVEFSKLINFQNLKLRKIKKNLLLQFGKFKNNWFYHLENQYFTIWKIIKSFLFYQKENFEIFEKKNGPRPGTSSIRLEFDNFKNYYLKFGFSITKNQKIVEKFKCKKQPERVKKMLST